MLWSSSTAEIPEGSYKCGISGYLGAALFLAVTMFAPMLSAQIQPVQTYFGQWPDIVGVGQVADAGDFNGDGINDHIVTASGYVYVYSGSDYTKLMTIVPPPTQPDDMWGKRTVVGVGNVGGTFHDDIAIQGANQVLIFTGRSGVTAVPIHSDQANATIAGVAGIGTAMAGGDIDGDGVSELVISAPDPNFGRVIVFDPGTSGLGDITFTKTLTIMSYAGDSQNKTPMRDGFGSAVAIIPAIRFENGESGPGIVVGADAHLVAGQYEDQRGRVYVFRADLTASSTAYQAASAALYRICASDVPAPGHFGGRISWIGDVDNDGFGDFIVAAADYSHSGLSEVGKVHVFLGNHDPATGATCPDQSGAVLADDIAYYFFEGTYNEDHVGAAVTYVGDIDCDGFDDIVVGAPFRDVSGTQNAGMVWVYSGKKEHPGKNLANNTILSSWSGHDPFGAFGLSMAGIRGGSAATCPTLLISESIDLPPPAPNDNNAGAVYVFEMCDKVRVEPGTHNFGNVEINQTADADITLTNENSSPVTVTLQHTCGGEFVVTNLADFPLQLAPGESAQMKWRFSPSSVGHKSCDVTIFADGTPLCVPLQLQGSGIDSDPADQPDTLCCESLNDAYHLGRTINADEGAVQITGPGGLTVNDGKGSSMGPQVQVSDDLYVGSYIQFPYVTHITDPSFTRAMSFPSEADGCDIISRQLTPDNFELVFRMYDNVTGDAFKIWFDSWRGEEFDRYPLEVTGTKLSLMRTGGLVAVGGTVEFPPVGFDLDIKSWTAMRFPSADDGSEIISRQLTPDIYELLVRIWDNNTGDAFKIWFDDYRGESYDKYPLVVKGDSVNLVKDGGRVFIGGTVRTVPSAVDPWGVTKAGLVIAKADADPFGRSETGTGGIFLPAHTDDYSVIYSEVVDPGQTNLILKVEDDSNDNILLLPSGSVGIGTKDPQAMLDVAGNVRIRDLPVGPGTKLQIDDNGFLIRGQGSSRRYKTRIRDLDTKLQQTLTLNPVRFIWKSNGEEDIGLIAEEVADILPDLVIVDKDGRPDGVKYEKLAVVLLDVVKEQEKVLRRQSERIDDLETALTELAEAIGK